ncbi:MAG: serine hydrolase [Flavobacteriales bacterium]|nr:serine hydrolase [Flavobacteriales bacterium]MBT5133806.1 serine hydrolase [Flavobacteriales bacterium]MBT6132396.1 serine hydrolase [Flavobacteriales bacterium]MBT6382735.1 serine hydrolase [Flavobacteriales bacterium]
MEKKKSIWQRLGKIAFWLLLIHMVVVITDHDYIYNTLAHTIFEGRLGPEIQDSHITPVAEIVADNSQPWKFVSEGYSLTNEEEDYHAEYQSVSFIVAHKESIVYQRYWQEFTENDVSNSFSMSKSIVSMLIGIALKRGEIESLDTPLYYYLPQYETELGKEVTLEHLMTMSSGFNFDEDYLNPFAFPARAYYGDNLEKLMEAYEPSTESGKVFRYQGGSSQLLAMVLGAATRTSISNYAYKHLWNPIGAERAAFWALDQGDGMEKASCCFYSTARDFTRLGQLYLNQGNWDGQQIVDSSFVSNSIRAADLVTEDGDKNKTYGYQWWVGEHRGLNFFYMRGIKGQYVLVVPEKELVITRLGRKRHYVEDRIHPEDVYHFLDMGLRMIGE